VDEYADEGLSAQTVFWLGVFLIGPVLVPLTIWRWRAAAARLAIPLLAVVYCLWVVIWATSLVGLAFWPAALVLLVASVVRAFVWISGPDDRVLTSQEVIGSAR
jgi:hypothetical protein